MSTYHIETDNGTYEVEVEDSPQQQSLLEKAWESLKKPEEYSKKGFQELSGLSNQLPQVEPTGNMFRDVALNTPQTLIQSGVETLGKVAPPMISRGSLVTMGVLGGLKAISPAVAPVMNMMGRGAANQMEQLSGAMPKSVSAEFNDASTILAHGKEKASALYNAAKEEMSGAKSIFDGMWKPEQIIDTAQEYIAKGGQLEPAEALTARKAIGSLMRSGRYVKDELIKLRDYFDDIAKSSENIAQADPLHQRALMGESLRNLMPQNKLGGASAFKLGIITALENMGLPGRVAGFAMSPAAQGLASGGLGLATRYGINPAIQQPIQAGAALGGTMGLLKKDSEE